MKKIPSSLGILSLLILGLVSAQGQAQAQVKETYVFRDSLGPIEGAGNVLVPVYNAGGTILTGGTGFVGGSFVDHTVSTSACASATKVRAWSFPISGGLRHPNIAPAVVTGSYSVSLLMDFNPMDSSYARLVDFSNSMSDNGIYKLGNGVSFYPVGTYAPGSFVEAQDVFVTITREASSKLVSLYINGVPSGTYTDANDLYAPAATVMYFLMDNTTGAAAISETDPGVISYLQVRSTPMSPSEVTASLAAICNTVACGDGTVQAGESCDDHGTVANDGCSPTCTVEPGFFCTGTMPTVCKAHTPCTAAQYETTAPTATTDRVCTACSVCGAGMVVATACTATKDTVCMVAAEAGVPDAGGFDTGPDDSRPSDAGGTEVSVADASLADAMADVATPDATSIDMTLADAMTIDAAVLDVAPMDTNQPDVAAMDASTPDTAIVDAGVADAGRDAAGQDAAVNHTRANAGCGCGMDSQGTGAGSAGAASMGTFALLALFRSRRRSRERRA